jgi:hypothetical protein
MPENFRVIQMPLGDAEYQAQSRYKRSAHRLAVAVGSSEVNA